MGQKNMIRLQFKARATVTAPINDDRQPVDFTGYFEIGDVVDVIDVSPAGKKLSTLGNNLTVLAIDPDTALTLSAAVDTTAAVGTPMVVCQEIDDGHTAVDRLYRLPRSRNPMMVLREPIVAQELNQPIAGKTLFRVANTKFIRPGDTFDILADEGLVASSVVIDSVSVQADDVNNKSFVVITTVVDTSTFTNPFLLAKDITLQDGIERNQSRIDGIDSPVENEDMASLNGVSDGIHVAFETVNLFVQNSAKVDLEGRKKIGTAGTRATKVQGAPGNSQLTFTSMLLGLLGNEVEVAVVAGAGLTVAVTKAFKSNTSGISTVLTYYRVSVNDNGGAATAKEIADAINANADAKRIVQAQYGGDGSGVVAAFALSALTGGLDNGTGDFAPIEQVYRNAIVNTGFKFISFHVRPDEENRMSQPPEDDEDLVIDYRKATENIG